MGLIILVIIFVVLAAIIVWLADWTSGGRRYTALAILNHRLASGEIDRNPTALDFKPALHYGNNLKLAWFQIEFRAGFHFEGFDVEKWTSY